MRLTDDLLTVVDCYKKAAGVPNDTTVSYRVFGDSKKLAVLRSGGDLLTSRYAGAVEWFDQNWPEDAPRPKQLNDIVLWLSGAEKSGAAA